MKKQIKKAACIAVTASILVLSACGGELASIIPTETNTVEVTQEETTAPIFYNEAPSSVEKHETVFVNVDNTGKVTKTTVSDRLHTDRGCVAVQDVSDLKNIVNVKSDILPVYGENGALTWHMDTQDLYYRGESTKKLPVSVEIKYYLNDTEISPEKLAGKSGKVRIEATMHDEQSKTVEIDGEKIEVYNPMIMAGVVILPGTVFSDVYTDSGKLISDGSKEIALLLAAPGIDESLGLSNLGVEGIDELKFGSTVSITAQTDSFSLGNMFFAAIPLSSVSTEIELSSTFAELQESLGKIKMLQSAFEKMDEKNILNMFLGNNDKIDEIVSIAENAVSLYNSNKALFEVLPKYMTQENIDILTKLLNDMDSSEVQDFVELMSSPVFTKFLKIMPDLADDMNDALPLIKEFSADMEKPEMQQAIENLPQTLKQLQELKTALDNNSELLESLSELLSGDNLDKISTVLGSVTGESLESKLKEYGVLAEDIDALISRFNAMLEYSKEYSVYSAVAENTVSSVMFIYQTPGISA